MWDNFIVSVSFRNILFAVLYVSFLQFLTDRCKRVSAQHEVGLLLYQLFCLAVCSTDPSVAARFRSRQYLRLSVYLYARRFPPA